MPTAGMNFLQLSFLVGLSRVLYRSFLITSFLASATGAVSVEGVT